MRRFIALPTLALLLASCAARSAVAPEEVLRRSAIANQNVTSAHLALDSTFTMPSKEGSTVKGSMSASGAMQNAGQQIQLAFKGDGYLTKEQTQSQWSAAGEIIIADEGEIYTKLDTLAINPPHPLFSSPIVTNLLGHWWKMPSNPSSQPPSRITPDPGFLQMQTAIIRVVEDKGIVAQNGHSVHHYKAAIDPEKLQAYLATINTIGTSPDDASLQQWLQRDIQGEVWIDAGSYALRKALWIIRGNDAADPLSITFTIEFSDHNDDIVIAPPVSAEPIPANPFTNVSSIDATIID